MNNIELSTIYLPILDEVYKEGAKTSVLDGDETTVRKGNNGEIKIAKLDMDALGDFDRKSGYTKGSTSLTWETVKYDKERSQDLRIDRLDNGETLAQPFAKLSSEFLKTKVIPEQITHTTKQPDYLQRLPEGSQCLQQPIRRIRLPETGS